MIRPPPLQLKFDNRFPMPLKSAIKAGSTSFLSQLYKANWKNPIIAVAGLNGLRFAFAAYNAFGDAVVDDLEAVDSLFKVSIALGVMYMLAFLIEVYGIVSVSMQRLNLIRGYVYLTLLASVLLTTAGALKGIAYFIFAEDIVWECVSLAVQGRGYERSLFRSHPWPSSVFPMAKKVARQHCMYSWVHESWSQVASVFLFFLVPAVVYYLIVYTYYRQTLDPNHSANLSRNSRSQQLTSAVRREEGYTRLDADQQQTRGGARGTNDRSNNNIANGMTTSRLQGARTSRRREPYGSRSNNGSLALNNNGSSVSLLGAGAAKPDPFATKGIKRSRRPPPLIASPSPLGLTPGPPTYGNSRVYRAFAAPVSSPDYDKFV